MSRQLNNPATAPRDYGAITSSSTSALAAGSSAAAQSTSTAAGATANVPDVNFSGFSPTEFMSLSEDIAHNISAVNSSWKQLEKILRIIGTPRDQEATRNKVHNINTKTNARIEATSTDLQRLTAVVRRGDKQQKLQLEKLTNDFRTVIEKFSAVQQRIATAMRKTFSQSQLAQMQDEQQATDRAELLQRQREIASGMQFEHEMLVDHERQIKQIESDVLDVNAIMRTVSSLVQAQAENVDRIEVGVDDAATEVELGRRELEKAAQHRRSYRRKILILLVFAVIIGLVVTGIIVAKLTS